MRSEEQITAAAFLDTWSDDPWSNGIQVDCVEDMECLVVETRNSTYEIVVIDGPRGEILVRGGQFFPERHPLISLGLHLVAASVKWAESTPVFGWRFTPAASAP